VYKKELKVKGTRHAQRARFWQRKRDQRRQQQRKLTRALRESKGNEEPVSMAEGEGSGIREL
jgi:hypothetical protein